MTSAAFNRRVRRATRTAAGVMLEDEVQKELVVQLRRGRVAFCHVPSEGMFPVQYRAKLKSLGLQKGVADLIFWDPPPCGGFVAAALEVKKIGGTLKPHQEAWLESRAAKGWATACEYGLDDCLARLRAWGYLP